MYVSQSQHSQELRTAQQHTHVIIMNRIEKEEEDIVIVGAGLVGCLLACNLCRNMKKRVTVYERYQVRFHTSPSDDVATKRETLHRMYVRFPLQEDLSILSSRQEVFELLRS